ncbi:MAG TPA: ATP-dependent DNA helicase [archaeon]|nr:ATP-dependent DNA helicase [archaeon]
MQVYFPHEAVRKQQKELMTDVLIALAKKYQLLVNAPTGIGKTASTIAPCLSYALEHGKKVFFLTPKSSQHEIALETANLMNKKFGLDIRTLDLVGKQKMCIHPMVSHVKKGFYEACIAAKKKNNCSFYANTKGKTLKQKANSRKRKSGIVIYGQDYVQAKEACRTRELCPYELTLEMIQKAHLIIGDYSHLFNDDIRQTILGNAKTKLEDIIIIIDEAHNLPSRIRDMLSITLKAEDIEKAAKEAKEINQIQAEIILNEIAAEIAHLSGKIPFGKNEHLVLEPHLTMLKQISKENTSLIRETASDYMQLKKKENSFLLETTEFLDILNKEKKHTLHISEMQRNSKRLSLYPLDVSEVTQKIFQTAHSSILMSGTLLPLKMYTETLGIPKAETKEYTSPFPKENRLNIFVDRTTTRYTERNEAQFDEIASITQKIISKVPGNTIVFFPSFEILNTIGPRIKTSRPMLEQKRDMSQDDKLKLVNEFRKLGRGFGCVMLAVSGGSIAEGIDFPGENLKCAIIVGVPFEKVSIQSKSLIDFYQQKFGKGWDYAYNAPAISKAVQAAGRVIRTEKDKGVCVFLDKRFSDPAYRNFFPKEFEAIKSVSPEIEVEKFFA